MSNVIYNRRSVKELDSLYSIKEESSWIQNDCIKIQNSFRDRGVNLTLIECKDLYSWYSEKTSSYAWDNSIDCYDEISLFKILYPALEEFLTERFLRGLNIVQDLKKDSTLRTIISI